MKYAIMRTFYFIFAVLCVQNVLPVKPVHHGTASPVHRAIQNKGRSNKQIRSYALSSPAKMVYKKISPAVFLAASKKVQAHKKKYINKKSVHKRCHKRHSKARNKHLKTGPMIKMLRQKKSPIIAQTAAVHHPRILKRRISHPALTDRTNQTSTSCSSVAPASAQTFPLQNDIPTAACLNGCPQSTQVAPAQNGAPTAALSATGPAIASAALHHQQTKAPANTVCPICDENKSVDQQCALGCGCTYCKECLGHAVNTALTAHDISQLRCPNPSCKKPFVMQDIQKITDDKTKIQTATLLFWLRDCPEQVRRCPHCPAVFLYPYNHATTIKCPNPHCAASYCSTCLKPHDQGQACSPSAIAQAQEFASAAYLQNHSKPCPRCNTLIQKEAGCNRIICGNQACKY